MFGVIGLICKGSPPTASHNKELMDSNRWGWLGKLGSTNAFTGNVFSPASLIKLKELISTANHVLREDSEQPMSISMDACAGLQKRSGIWPKRNQVMFLLKAKAAVLMKPRR